MNRWPFEDDVGDVDVGDTVGSVGTKCVVSTRTAEQVFLDTPTACSSFTSFTLTKGESSVETSSEESSKNSRPSNG